METNGKAKKKSNGSYGIYTECFKFLLCFVRNFESLEAVPHFGECCFLSVDSHSARIPPAGDHLQKKSKALGPDGLPANTIRQNIRPNGNFFLTFLANRFGRYIPHKDTRACHPNALVYGSRRSTSHATFNQCKHVQWFGQCSCHPVTRTCMGL